MNIIGDIHGNFQRYFHILKGLKGSSVQLGDHGHAKAWPPDAIYCHESLLKRGHGFIPGNHDDQEVCREMSNYLGEVGYRAPAFWIGGGLSIDRASRKPGVSWWPNEQLTERQREFALELYEAKKPRVVLSHDAPTGAADVMLRAMLDDEATPYDDLWYIDQKLIGVGQSVLSALMQKMLEIHAPEQWYFGHFHTSKTFCIPEFRTQFTCVNIMEVVEAPFEFEDGGYTSIMPDGTPCRCGSV